MRNAQKSETNHDKNNSKTKLQTTFTQNILPIKANHER